MHSSTGISPIERADAAPITTHRVRDFEAFRPWEPSRSAESFTP
ncbi:hypothetical protein GCM10010433_27620 [Streptomyces pulveraceus]